MQITSHARKHLEIGNYPPPYDGWGTHTKFVVDEIRRRGHICSVLKINDGRQFKSAEYVDVQNGLDYALKVLGFAIRGFSLNTHVNAESSKGFWLAFISTVMGRMFLRRATITFHGGIPQSYFPAPTSSLWYWKFKLLFALASGILCDSDDIKRHIVRYGVHPGKIGTAAGFSAQNLSHQTVPMNSETEKFLRSHHPLLFCYVSYRPEYRLDVLRAGMALFRKSHPHAGFIWLGFPEKELPAANQYVSEFLEDEKQSLLLLGCLSHDEFLTLLLRCDAKLRTPACDGVSASVLESLALGIPVVASQNGRRPDGVITYSEMDAVDMCRKLEYLFDNMNDVKLNIRVDAPQDNVAYTSDWLLGESHKHT